MSATPSEDDLKARELQAKLMTVPLFPTSSDRTALQLISQFRADARAEGIREAAAAVERLEQDDHVYGFNEIADAILALLDPPPTGERDV